ncbi:hypothetical protein [Pseudomonas sp. CGJS7]|uniref:hypothetical protein n=1 Tax=Pseudomonas sp. CGJS7 TaxID=3109348 RepID=UPI00300B53F3
MKFVRALVRSGDLEAVAQAWHESRILESQARAIVKAIDDQRCSSKYGGGVFRKQRAEQRKWTVDEMKLIQALIRSGDLETVAQAWHDNRIVESQARAILKAIDDERRLRSYRVRRPPPT